MLVLSRKTNQRLVITKDGEVLVTLKVKEIRGDKVSLGIEADQSYGVHREEVWEAIQREKGRPAS